MAMDAAGGLAGIGVSAATGNYIGAGIGLLGLGMSLFGGQQQAEDAQEYARRSLGVQTQIWNNENLVNNQREQALQLSSRRSNLEQMRLAQRTSARANANAVNQGAQFGSGIQGGQAQIAGQSNFNILGTNQNTEIGENIFGINRDISNQKLQLAQLQSQYQQTSAANQGLMSLGGGLMQASGPISRLSQGGNPFTSYSGPSTGFTGIY